MDRDKSIDILKGIGILFVIIAHIAEYIPTNLLIYIYSFHMPLFFFISGYLYKDKYLELSTKQYIYKRFLQLIYPYFTLNLINFLWMMITNHSLEKMGKYILSFLYSNYIFESNYVGAVWFLGCLFMVEIIYFIIKKKQSKYLLNISLVINLILGIIMSEVIKLHYFRFPFWLDIAFFGIIFYHIGYVTKNITNKLNVNNYKRIVGIFIFIIINIGCIYLNYKYSYTEKFLGRVDMLYLHLGNYLYFFIGAIAGIFSWLLISKIINKNIIFELFGKNTLLIMGIHLIILGSLKKIIKILNISNNLLCFMILFSLTSVSSILCSIFIKKFLPIITDCSKIKLHKKGEDNGAI